MTYKFGNFFLLNYAKLEYMRVIFIN